MSTFQPEEVECPHCNDRQIMAVAHSINATRAPQYRQQILAGQFQAVLCRQCQQLYFIDRPFMYIDTDRKEWLGFFPTVQEPAWAELEQMPTEAFAIACGSNAPAIARNIGHRMKIRTVFGLLALREKILCFEAGLDDVALEVLKLQLLAQSYQLAASIQKRPRLLQIEQEQMIFIYPDTNHASIGDYVPMAVPLQAYHHLHNNPLTWSELQGQLTHGSYVDLGRLFL